MIKKWKRDFIRWVFSAYYRRVVAIHEELLDRRIVNVVTLNCDHISWQEVDKPVDEKLCETCLLRGMTVKLGERKGMKLYQKWCKYKRSFLG